MLVIDRIEGDIAVVEVDEETFQNIPLDHILGNVRDGAVIEKLSFSLYQVNEKETQSRSQAIEQLMKNFFNSL